MTPKDRDLVTQAITIEAVRAAAEACGAGQPLRTPLSGYVEWAWERCWGAFDAPGLEWQKYGHPSQN